MKQWNVSILVDFGQQLGFKCLDRDFGSFIGFVI